MNIFDLVSTFAPAAQIPAYRKIAHTSMARAFGAIRQDIRNRKRLERKTDSAINSLDQRNELDENTRAETLPPVGLAQQTMEPLMQAQLLISTYQHAHSELETLRSSSWDKALQPNEMLSYMLSRTENMPEAVLEALASATSLPVETLRQTQEALARQEREDFVEALPEIKHTFEGLSGKGFEEDYLELPVRVRLGIAENLLDGLKKAKTQALTRILRTRRLDSIGDIPLIDEAISKTDEWLKLFQERFSDELTPELAF